MFSNLRESEIFDRTASELIETITSLLRTLSMENFKVIRRPTGAIFVINWKKLRGSYDRYQRKVSDSKLRRKKLSILNVQNENTCNVRKSPDGSDTLDAEQIHSSRLDKCVTTVKDRLKPACRDAVTDRNEEYNTSGSTTLSRLLSFEIYNPEICTTDTTVTSGSGELDRKSRIVGNFASFTENSDSSAKGKESPGSLSSDSRRPTTNRDRNIVSNSSVSARNDTIHMRSLVGKSSDLILPVETKVQPMAAPYKYDVYLAASQDNLDTALQLLKELEDHGFSCLFGERDFELGQPICNAIVSAVQTSHHVVLLFSQNSMDMEWFSFELLTSLGLMYETNRVLIVPVLVDISESDIPICLQRFTWVNMQSDPNYITKLFSILEGPDIGINDIMPAGNVAHGLVWNYYLNYLRFTLPGIRQRVDQWCEMNRNGKCRDEHMSRMFYVLVPASCFCPASLSNVDKSIEFGGHLADVSQTRAGSVGRVYRHSVWNIRKSDGKVLHFVGEYATVVHTLYQMEKECSAGIDSRQLKLQRNDFLSLLRAILSKYGHKEAEVVFFNDTDSSGQVVPVSKILTPLVEADRELVMPVPLTTYLQH